MSSNFVLKPSAVQEIKTKLIRIFHEGDKSYDEIASDIGLANDHFKWIRGTDFSDEDPKLAYDFLATFYNLLHYYDIENPELNDYILLKFNEYIKIAKKLLETHPEVCFSILRLTLCASIINYRKQKYVKGLECIKQIKEVIELQNPKLSISPSLLGDLYFEEAKLLVRLNQFSKAKLLFANAVKKYEEWAESELISPEDNEGFKDFITYKISVTQAFGLYSRILQGKINTVARETSILERLLDYTKHKKLKYFVKMLRAKALRLGGFQNPKQLTTAIQIFKECQSVFESQNSRKLNSAFNTYNYQRHYLMNLYQQGLSLLYLTDSYPKTSVKKAKTEEFPAKEKIFDNLKEIITIISEKGVNEYWKIRANLLEIYLLLNKKDYESAFEIAARNSEVKHNNVFLQIECLTALAEVGISYLKILKRSNQTSEGLLKYNFTLEITQQALNECSEIELDLAENSEFERDKSHPKSPLKILALYYLLQCDLHIFEEKYDEAKTFWNKWSEVSDFVEFSRWQKLADAIKKDLDNSDNKLIIDLKSSLRYERVKKEFERELYNKIKARFPTDLKRIEALGISRETFYNWKRDYDKS